MSVELLFQLMERRGANYKLFFTEASQPIWIPILRERGYFSNPPNADEIDEGESDNPYWWPMHYLSRVATADPDSVSAVLLELPIVNNVTIQRQFLDIACQLPGHQSVRLKQKVFQFDRNSIRLLSPIYLGLLTHWVTQGQFSPALELADILLRFERTPNSVIAI